MSNGRKVCVLGGGAWGTALAKVLADKGDPVALWCRRDDLAEQINRDHTNAHYLPAAPLPEHLRATSNLADALEGASMVVFVSPSHATRDVARAARDLVPTDVPIVSATKGIENDSLMFIDEILEGGERNQGNFDDGAWVQETINAVERSVQERRWVDLPLDGAESR